MVILFVVVVIIVPMVILFVVVVIIVPMLIFFVVVMISMIFKGTTLAELQLGQTMRLHQRDGLGVGRDAFNRVFKKRLKIMTHPEH